MPNLTLDIDPDYEWPYLVNRMVVDYDMLLGPACDELGFIADKKTIYVDNGEFRYDFKVVRLTFDDEAKYLFFKLKYL